MKRFSRKRESILACLRQTKEHPDAEEIYRRVKDRHPDLSLGTVYRNLNELEEAGEIRTVAVVQDKARYDARTEQHPHIVCVKCGRVADIEGISLPPDFLREAGNVTDFEISEVSVQFSGICADCRKGENQDAERHE